MLTAFSPSLIDSQEVRKIGEDLRLGHVPFIWDWLLPEPLVKMMEKLKMIKRTRRPSTRLVLFVDDLDRCKPSKILEILQSIILLGENTPFIIFLAVDPRVIVSAIESDDGNFFGDTGINGYEYLDKIVQVPFSMPELCVDEVQKMVKGYLTGGGKEDPAIDSILESVRRSKPTKISSRAYTGPLLLCFREEADKEARIEYVELKMVDFKDAILDMDEEALRAQTGSEGLNFELAYWEDATSSEKKKNIKISQYGVLLARWWFLKAYFITSDEEAEIKTILSEKIVGKQLEDAKIMLKLEVENCDDLGAAKTIADAPPASKKEGTNGASAGEGEEAKKNEAENEAPTRRELNYDVLLEELLRSS